MCDKQCVEHNDGPTYHKTEQLHMNKITRNARTFYESNWLFASEVCISYYFFFFGNILSIENAMDACKKAAEIMIVR